MSAASRASCQPHGLIRIQCSNLPRCKNSKKSATASSHAPAASPPDCTRASTAASARRDAGQCAGEPARMAAALGVAADASSPATRSIPPTWWWRRRRGRGRTRHAPTPSSRAFRASPSACRPPTAGRCCSPIRRPASSARPTRAGKARSPASSRRPSTAMERLGATRAHVVAAIGPLIRQPNYEVGPDLVERFVAVDDADNRAVLRGVRARGTPCSTLPAMVRSRLMRRASAGSTTSGSTPMPMTKALLQLSPYDPPGEPDYGRQSTR